MSKYQDINIEEEYWNDFIVEAFEHIEDIETNVISLEQNPEDMDIIHTMFRAFHTIKGLSGFVEHTAIQEIAHKTETLMDFCRKGELQVSTPIVDAILKSSDYIKKLCEDVDSVKDLQFEAQIEELLMQLEELTKVNEWKQLENAMPEKVSTPESEENSVIQHADSSVEKSEQELDFNNQVEVFVSESDFEQKENPIEDEENQELISNEIDNNQQVSKEIFNVDEGWESLQELKTGKIEENDVTEEKTNENLLTTNGLSSEEQQKFIEKLTEKLATPVQNSVQKPEKVVVIEEKPKEIPLVQQSQIKKISVNEEYMKVANNKIDHLVDMIGELIISQSLIEQYITSNYSQDNCLITNMSGFLRITRELQNLSMSLRMVSLKPTFQKLSRIARDTIQELKKDVEFTISGENTEIDRVVTDKLLDPLVHLIKNAISHGVEENSEDRISTGKSRKAHVELSAYNKRGKIFIEVKDDGRGIDTEIVYQKAKDKGLIDESKTYNDAEIKEFILLPGFSTAKVVDNISGRGVGMDVVKTQISKIGGKIDIESYLGKGSTFTLEVPVNHAIMNGTIVEINDQQFIVPTINVKEILQPEEKQWIFTQQQKTMIRVRDNIIPLISSTLFFKEEENIIENTLVVILELDGEMRALPITNVVNRQEVVVKPVGEEFTYLKYISGMSILGTGKVSLILDIDYLFKKEVK